MINAPRGARISTRSLDSTLCIRRLYHARDAGRAQPAKASRSRAAACTGSSGITRVCPATVM
jgi:hypothetical protein